MVLLKIVTNFNQEKKMSFHSTSNAELYLREQPDVKYSCDNCGAFTENDSHRFMCMECKEQDFCLNCYKKHNNHTLLCIPQEPGKYVDSYSSSVQKYIHTPVSNPLHRHLWFHFQDNGKGSKPRYEKIKCDICDTDIIGYRFDCQTCSKKFCEQCDFSGKHDSTHTVTRTVPKKRRYTRYPAGFACGAGFGMTLYGNPDEESTFYTD